MYAVALTRCINVSHRVKGKDKNEKGSSKKVKIREKKGVEEG